MMRDRKLLRVVFFVVVFLLLPAIETISQTVDELPLPATAPRSVEERRLLAALEEQKARLQAKEEILNQREMELKTLEREVDKKMEDLRKAREEASALLQQKSEAEDKRLRSLSAMYEKMAPEKAAALLASMEEDLAVSILAGMKGKTAGRVLENMERGKAARLSLEYSKL